ncbi:MAG: translation initiation factor IF-2 [Ardenticatenia bacterium]|nr:translation initiation factor IF-2 [Ardenticatenia bacterium]
MSGEESKPAADGNEERIVQVPSSLTVRDLAGLMDVSPIDIIKQMMNDGIMANINQQIDFDTAAIVGSEMGFEIVPELFEEEALPAEPGVPPRWRFISDEDPANLRPRPPIVTVLGHVDHGKTTLLDTIRETNVQAGEAGGITQHIGAYQIDAQGRKITFLDTPGHKAFTAMRARGAQCTDLVILVVAADDGVMPQTREAIDHARAAQVPILVALNKVDKSDANIDRAKQQLADVDLLVEDWGGEVICVPISAKERQGIEDLLENIFLVTEVAELKANADRLAQGTAIEGTLNVRQGVTVTLLVQNGTLHIGDVVVIGDRYGKVRAMFDDQRNRIQDAGPSMPVAILGLPSVPTSGDLFEVVESERVARDLIAVRAEAAREVAKVPPRTITLDDIFQRMQAGDIKDLNLVLKADVQGSIEPIAKSLADLGSDKLKVNILHQGTGNISESDVMLAVASSAIVIGFNVEIDSAAQRLAQVEAVDVRRYHVIYRLIDDIDKALQGLLEPTYRDVVTGQAEVKAIFRIPRRGSIAGSYVLDGQITRNGLAHVLRGEEQIYEGKIASLKRFTEDVQEVASGYECGIRLEGFNDFQEGDIIECYQKERE